MNEIAIIPKIPFPAKNASLDSHRQYLRGVMPHLQAATALVRTADQLLIEVYWHVGRSLWELRVAESTGKSPSGTLMALKKELKITRWIGAKARATYASSPNGIKGLNGNDFGDCMKRLYQQGDFPDPRAATAIDDYCDPKKEPEPEPPKARSKAKRKPQTVKSTSVAVANKVEKKEKLVVREGGEGGWCIRRVKNLKKGEKGFKREVDAETELNRLKTEWAIEQGIDLDRQYEFSFGVITQHDAPNKHFLTFEEAQAESLKWTLGQILYFTGSLLHTATVKTYDEHQEDFAFAEAPRLLKDPKKAALKALGLIEKEINRCRAEMETASAACRCPITGKRKMK